jgi:ABC-type glycerol-3-phosphate transport system permease component
VSALAREQARTLGASRRARPGPWLNLAVLVVLTAVFSLPTVWLVLTSLKRETEYASYPITVLPQVWQPGNYVAAVTIFPYLKFFGNSAFLAGTYTVLVVLSSAAAGFGFSRHRGVPGRDLLFAVLLSTMMVPQLVTLVPQYMLFAEFGLLNSYWPWILWGLHGSAFHIFLFRQFFAAIPKDLEDAAEVDGCGKFRIFWQIFLPNSLPAICASAIFSFTWVWGDWLYPKLFLNDQITTLAVRLATSYVNPQNQPLYTVTMAGVVVYVLPMVLVFFLAQKYIIQGVVTTGLKG